MTVFRANRIAGNANGVSESYGIASGSNRLLSVSGAVTRSFSYDGAGNVANDNRPGGVAYSYGHSAAGDLASVTLGAAEIASYTSDARHLRAIKRVPGGAFPQVDFIYDGEGRLLAEHDGISGAPLREYIWSDDLPVAMANRLQGAAAAPYYIHADHLGRPRKLTDQAGAVVWDGAFAPFGEAHYLDASITQNLRFPGQYADAETGGLSYNWHRTYDPRLGRYLQSDPIGLAGGINTYGYAEGNPVRYTDPEGLIIDTLADLGFIGYDLYRLFQDGACNLSDNLAALGLDAAGAIIPGVTGLGAASRAGKAFTKAGKQVVKEKNAAKNAGKMKCENCSQDVVPGKQHQKGVTPPENEAHVDHIQPKSKGGAGSPENGRVLCRSCNLNKHNR